MWGLIVKDLKNLKTQAKLFLVIAAVYLLFGIQSGNFMMLGGFAILLAAILPVTALAYDERSKWECYALTMPVTRTQLVLSKYLLGLLLSGGVTVVIVIAQSFMVEFKEALLSTLILFGVGLFLSAILLPITLKLGTEKARILFLLIFALPVLCGFLLAKAQLRLPPLSISPVLLAGIGIAALLLIYGVSVVISVKIYRKKEW